VEGSVSRKMREIFNLFASVFGLFISLGTVITVTFPNLREKIKEKLFASEKTKEEICAIRSLLEEHVLGDADLKKEFELQREVDLCVLRDLITGMYYKRLGEKKIHMYELEDVSALHDLYQKRGGNSYVHNLYRQMAKEWEVIK
jgi:hypothetical protein